MIMAKRSVGQVVRGGGFWRALGCIALLGASIAIPLSAFADDPLVFFEMLVVFVFAYGQDESLLFQTVLSIAAFVASTTLPSRTATGGLSGFPPHGGNELVFHSWKSGS